MVSISLCKGTITPASNALWTLSTLIGSATIRTLIGHRNNNFCLAASGTSLEVDLCNGTLAQLFVVGQE
jgi:hypothetical protein